MKSATFEPFTIELVGQQAPASQWLTWLVLFVFIYLFRSLFMMLCMTGYLFVRERLVNANRNLYLFCYDRNDVPEGGYKIPIGMTPIRKVGYHPELSPLLWLKNPLVVLLEWLARTVNFKLGKVICLEYPWPNLREHRKKMPKAHIRINRHFLNRGITITVYYRYSEKEKWESESVALMAGEYRQLKFDEKFQWALMIK